MSHALAFLAAILSGLPWAIKGLLCLAIAASHWRARHALTAVGQQQRLIHTPETGWNYAEKDGILRPLTVLSSSVVTPWFVVLHGASGSRARNFLIFPDSTDRESFRRLRVAMRTRSGAVKSADT